MALIFNFLFQRPSALRHFDAEDLAHRRARQHTAFADKIVIGAVGEHHVEGDAVDPGVLAADRLGNLGKFARRHYTPASVRKVGNSSSGLSTRIVWLTVQR